jgi:hypothetical protein
MANVILALAVAVVGIIGWAEAYGKIFSQEFHSVISTLIL